MMPTSSRHLPRPVTELDREEMMQLVGRMTTLRQIHHILLKMKNEQDMYRNLCRQLTKLDGMAFVWIGLCRDGADRLEIAAAGGPDPLPGTLPQLPLEGADAEALPPAAMAVESRQIVLVRSLDVAASTCIVERPSLMNLRQSRPLDCDPFHRVLNPAAGAPERYHDALFLPLLSGESVLGVIGLYAAKPDLFDDQVLVFLTEMAGDIAFTAHSLRVEKQLENSFHSLGNLFNQTVDSVSMIHEFRDQYTSTHQKRVADLACAIARKMGHAAEELQGIHIAARLHDIGKILLPAELFVKSEELTPAELAQIKTHPEASYKILKSVDFPWPVTTAILQHHERLNGSGYPHGLKGDEISWEGRLLAVADVVEAISAPRPYRPARELQQALDEITLHKGELYDPEIVDVCVELFRSGSFSFEN